MLVSKLYGQLLINPSMSDRQNRSISIGLRGGARILGARDKGVVRAPSAAPVALPFLNVSHTTVLRANSNIDIKKFIFQFQLHFLFINALVKEIVLKKFWGRLI
jgi:hypothetical protein